MEERTLLAAVATSVASAWASVLASGIPIVAVVVGTHCTFMLARLARLVVATS